MSSTTFARALSTGRPRYGSGTLSFSFPSGVRMLISGREWRWPISLSTGSWAGVTFTAPVPNSRSTCASAMMGIWRPVSGRATIFPTRPA